MMKKQTETWRPFMGKMVCLTVMIVFAEIGALNAADLGHARGTQWVTCLKWSVDNPSWTGSPLEVIATVVFTHQPTGEKRITEMYYDGATNWAFRFTGTKQGVWTFVCASNDPDLDGHAGKVTIAKTAHVGVCIIQPWRAAWRTSGELIRN